MDRTNDILNGIKTFMSESAEMYGGKKRSELKDSDFLFPETRSFPIVTPADVPDAINNLSYGTMIFSLEFMFSAVMLCFV